SEQLRRCLRNERRRWTKRWRNDGDCQRTRRTFAFFEVGNRERDTGLDLNKAPRIQSDSLFAIGDRVGKGKCQSSGLSVKHLSLRAGVLWWYDRLSGHREVRVFDRAAFASGKARTAECGGAGDVSYLGFCKQYDSKLAEGARLMWPRCIGYAG